MSVAAIKIAFLCNEYPPPPVGGIGAFVQTLGRAMVAAGHSVTVVGLGETASEREDCGVRVVTLARARGPGMRWWRDRRLLRRWLLTEVRAGRVNLIEVPDYEGLMPFRFDACPVVVRLHLSESVLTRRDGGEAPAWVTRCEKATLKNHRTWFALNSWFADRTADHFGLQPERQEILAPLLPKMPPELGPNDTTTYPGRYVLFAGTVSERKGAQLLAKAMRPLLAVDPTLRLVFAGRSTTTIALHAQIELVGPRPRDEVLAAMRGATVFAFPSPVESYGLVIDEAMLAGAPVVTLDHPLFRSRIQHGETGLLVPEDDVTALRDAIQRLLEDCDGARRIGKAGQKAAEKRCDPVAVLARQISAYEGSLSRVGQPI